LLFEKPADCQLENEKAVETNAVIAKKGFLARLFKR